MKGGPRHRSQGAPENMRVVRGSNGEKGGKRANGLSRGAEVDTEESDGSYLPKMLAVKKIGLVKEKLEKMKKNHHGLMISLQLTQRKLKRMKGESIRNHALIESSTRSGQEKKVKREIGESWER